MKKIALIDAYGFVFRAFHSLPPLNRNDGTPVGAVYGFTNMLIKILASLEVSHIAVVFDSGSKTFRNELYPNYKANRPPCPEELIPQFPIIRSCAESLNLPVLEKVGFEADDIIATIAKKSAREGFEVLVISSDKDLMQLVDEKILMFDAMKNRLITKQEVKEKFAVEPSQVLDILALIGDSSDNIPGVKGIGPKTAAELINEFGNLENLLENLDKIKQNKRKEYLVFGKESAILSKKLAKLEENVELNIELSDLEVKAINPEKLIKFLQEQDFRSLILKVKKEFSLGNQNSEKNIGDFDKPGLPEGNSSKNSSQNPQNQKTFIQLDHKNPEQSSPHLAQLQYGSQNNSLTNSDSFSGDPEISSKIQIFPTRKNLQPKIIELKTYKDLHQFHIFAQKNGRVNVDFLIENGEFCIITLSSSDNFEIPQEVFYWQKQKNCQEKSQENFQEQNQKQDWEKDKSAAKNLNETQKISPNFSQNINDLPLFAAFQPDKNTAIMPAHSQDNEEISSINRGLIFADFAPLFCDDSLRKTFYDGKVFLRSWKNHFRSLDQDLCKAQIIFDDVKLQNYLLNSSIQNNLRSLIESNLDLEFEELGFGEILKELEEEFTDDEIDEDLPIKSGTKNEDFQQKISDLFGSKERQKEFFYYKNIAIFQLGKIFAMKLFQNSLNSCYFSYELPLISVLAEMEFNGIHIDCAGMKNLSQEFGQKIAVLSKKIYEIAGEEFNIASNKQLSYILFEKLGVNSSKKSKKTGAPSTRARVLDELAEDGLEIAINLREFRKYYKLKNTYTDALPKAINPTTDRIHSHFSNIATLTGRLSSSNPNLQNLPIKSEEGKRIRRLFIAEKGNVLISADYSQIELRMIAHLAEVAELIKAFQNNRDIHCATAAEVFNVKEGEVGDELRNKAKAINFGIIYGISPFGLAKQLKISTTEAANYINSYLKTYPGIAEYMNQQIELAQKQGFVKTISGRKCFIQNINNQNRFIREEAQRQALNAPVQGSAADIIKKAMIRLQNRIDQEKLPIRLILQIHDELVIETNADFKDLAAKILRQEMERSYELLVPLKVDLKIH